MIDSLLVYLLLLVGVAFGWVLGFCYARQGKKSTPNDWIPSVELLLAEKSDASLERLLSGSLLDDDALDLFLKLGKALREKGEVDRAIHLHQSLFARADIPRDTLQILELELAIDFLCAGLNDRAERLLKELLRVKGRIREQSSLYLVELYEEEGEWHEILRLYQEKQLSVTSLLGKRIAHAACELAEQSCRRADYFEAQKYCRLALKIDGQCARAFVVLGDMSFDQEGYREAIRCYLRSLDIDSQVLIQILDKLVQAFKVVNDTSGLLMYLRRHWQSTSYVPALTEQIKCKADKEGAESALTSLLEALSDSPSNSGFFALVEVVVDHRLQLDKSQLLTLYDILRRIVENEPRFVCKSCGFKAKEAHWRCPSCKNWASLSAFTPSLSSAKLKL